MPADEIENLLGMQTLLAIYDEISTEGKRKLLALAQAIRRAEPGTGPTKPYAIDDPPG